MSLYKKISTNAAYQLLTFKPHLIKNLFFLKEVIKDKLSSTPTLNILLSKRPDWENVIRKGFKHTQHKIRFDVLSPDNIRKNDLVIPLSIDDIQILNKNKKLIADNPLPIPDNTSVNICNDKSLFYEFLEQNGFESNFPALRKTNSYPYILKKKITEFSVGSHIIHCKEDEIKFRDFLSNPEYFAQEIIPGKKEYAAHILFENNKIIAHLTIKKKYPHQINESGRDSSVNRISSSLHLPLFTSILQALQFEGICCIDYKIVDNKPVIFEINPRIGASLSEFLFSFINAAYINAQKHKS